MFTNELADEICERLAGGESLVSICESSDYMPNRCTVFQWLYRFKDFANKYALAREAWADAEFERLMEIADTPQFGAVVKTFANGEEETTTTDMVMHRRLQVDTRKWALARMSPKKFGELTRNEITNPDGSLKPASPEQAAQRIAALLAKAKQRKAESTEAPADDTDYSDLA